MITSSLTQTKTNKEILSFEMAGYDEHEHHNFYLTTLHKKGTNMITSVLTTDIFTIFLIERKRGGTTNERNNNTFFPRF